MRFSRILTLLIALVLGACAGMDVSYDFTELDERNLLRGEPD